jgi:site-specific DNA-methyltransferase (adenine-specific)
MLKPETIAKGIELYAGDCMAVLAGMEPDSVDSCVTDPPYHLTSIVKRFGKTSQADDTDTSDRARKGSDGMARLSRGFMGKVWDGGEIAFEPETWAAVYRVLKPGGHLCAFGAPKNFGFMQYAISQAGFEVRDVLAWLFGSGFPKSHNAGNGWGTALKPAYEPIIMARKPLIGTVAENVREHGTGALNIDGCRVGTDGGTKGCDAGPSNGILGDGLNGSFGKPVPGLGRWPANVIHDGSDEVVGAFPICDSPRANGNPNERTKGTNGMFRAGDGVADYRDTGSAARFFYTAKADSDDRLGSKHPTVKPVDLMQWLVRLVTPKGGLVLDPFAGTGTTGEAAFREGMRAILIEREAEYQDDIRRRMKLALAGPDERARESIKAKTKDAPIDAGPLFSDWDEMWKKPFATSAVND